MSNTDKKDFWEKRHKKYAPVNWECKWCSGTLLSNTDKKDFWEHKHKKYAPVNWERKWCSGTLVVRVTGLEPARLAALEPKDADPFNMISGTTGLSGCADGSFLLSESKRGSKNATLYCVGRDIENREIELKFDSDAHRWITDEKFPEKDNKNKIFIGKIFDFIIEKKKFIGTATELANLLAPKFDTELFPSRLIRNLVQSACKLESY